MNSKLRDALFWQWKCREEIEATLPGVVPQEHEQVAGKIRDKHVAKTKKAIRQAVGEEMLELLPTDENVTTKYGYHRDEKKYGYRLAIVDVKEVIKQWQRGEDEDIS